MTKTLTGYDVMVYVKMSLQRHLKQCHICIQNVIIKRKTLNDSCQTLLHIQFGQFSFICTNININSSIYMHFCLKKLHHKDIH